MNLIRLIKLKKINGELDYLTEQEKYFFSLFDNLIFNNSSYNKDCSIYFYLDLKNKYFYYSYEQVLLKFKSKFSMNELEINILICDILETKLDLSGFTPLQVLPRAL